MVFSDCLGVFIIPSSKLVELIIPIASNYGSEAARSEYGVVSGVGHGGNLQLAGCKWSISGQIALELTICLSNICDFGANTNKIQMHNMRKMHEIH